MTQADETIVLGARDQASKVLDQVGDNNQRLGRRVATMSKKTEAATKRAAGGFMSMGKAVGPLVAAFGALKAGQAAIRFLSSSSEAFEVQQEAVRGLTRAIELSGDAVGPTIAQHEAFASTLQNYANVGDEVTLGLMKQASMLGVNNDQLQNVTSAAIGLAEATGQSLETSLRKTVEAVNGSTSSMARYLPALKSAATEEERLAIITEAANKGLLQKADRAKNAAGMSERLANSWGDLQEKIGSLLEPIKLLIATGLSRLVETIQGALIPASDSAGSAIDRMRPILDAVSNAAHHAGTVFGVYIETISNVWSTLSEAIFGQESAFTGWGETVERITSTVSKAVIGYLTFMEVAYTNLGSVVRLAGQSVQLALVKLYENTKHTLTVQIPEVLTWFSDNWQAILQDAFSASVAIAQNYAKRTADTLSRLWEFVASGGKGGFGKLVKDLNEISAQPLLEGFQATLEEMPNITERAITDTEKRLQESIGRTAGSLGDQFREKYNERIARLSEDAKAAADKAKTPEVDQLTSSAATKAGEQVDKIAKATKEGIEVRGKVEQDAAVQAKESRLLTRGDSNDPANQTAQNTAKTADGVASLHPALARVADVLSAVTGGLTSQIGTVLSQFQPVDPSAMLAGIPQAIGAEVGQVASSLTPKVDVQPSGQDAVREELAAIRKLMTTNVSSNQSQEGLLRNHLRKPDRTPGIQAVVVT